MTPLRTVLSLLLAAMLTGCGLPLDPEGTLDRVEGGRMRVGITEHLPWTVLGQEPAGVEVELVEAFADDLGADVEWVEGSHDELLSALEQRELELVVGGFTADDPWSSKVTFTQPYVRVRTVIGVAPGAMPPQDLEGVRVSVEAHTETVSLLTSADAVPLEVEDLGQAEPPVAAPEWEVRSLGLQPTDLILTEDQHVMATPHGENAWLVRLERFLRSRLGAIPDLLQEHAA
jgi:polar amino acid transport system substrate-binding protein